MRRISGSVNSGRAVEVGLGVEPDRDAGPEPPAPAGPLPGRRLADRLDRQPLHLGPMAVAGDPRRPRVDHVPDARHGQRGLGDVRGQDDASPAVRGEDLVLVGGRQPGVERDDLGGRQRPLGQRVLGVADLPLPGEEHEDVARALGDELVDGIEDGGDLVAVGIGVLVVRVDDRAVAHLDGIGPAGDLDDRGAAEVGRHPLDVDRRRGDDQLQVGTPRQQLGEVAQQEVDVEAPLVGLVEDDRVVLPQQPVVRDLGQQDAVGHQLDHRGVAHLVGEPHLEADGLAERAVQLLGDPLGDAARGDAARLGVPDPAPHPAAESEGDLGQLGGLPRPGLAGDHDHLVVAQRGGDVVAPGADGQFLGVAERRDGGPAPGDARLGRGDVGGDPLALALAGLRVAGLPEPVEPPAQPVLVEDRELRQPCAQIVGRGTHGGARIPLENCRTTGPGSHCGSGRVRRAANVRRITIGVRCN